MAFNTSNTVVSTGNAGKYLSPGLNDSVVVVGFAYGESSQKKTPYLEVTVSKQGEPDNTAKDKFYFSEKAEAKSLEKIVHILQDGAGIDRAAIDKAGVDASDLTDYATKLNALLPKQKPFRMKLTGEEYLKDGVDLKVGKRIGFTPFAEPMSVAMDKSGLTYDKTNKYDYIALPADAKPQAASAPAGSDDLPF
jgi:hypothetical protein